MNDNSVESESNNGVDKKVDRLHQVLVGCFTFFAACLIISSVTAAKLWQIDIAGYAVGIPVGTSLFAITFLCTDIVGEIWGRTYSLFLVGFGAIARVLALLFFRLAVWIEPASFWSGQKAYAEVLNNSDIIIIAGLLAYVVSQTNDVFVFHALKKVDGRNYLWKRNILSTASSQFLDSFVFVVVAFGGTLSIKVIIATIIGQVIVKYGVAVFDTPFVYMARNYVEGRNPLGKIGEFAMSRISW